MDKRKTRMKKVAMTKRYDIWLFAIYVEVIISKVTPLEYLLSAALAYVTNKYYSFSKR